jgi:hypothetical protein
VYDVTERRVSEDFTVLSNVLRPTLDEIEAVGAQGGQITGVPTGFSDLDRLTSGLLRRAAPCPTHAEGVLALFTQSTAWLRRHRMLLPG